LQRPEISHVCGACPCADADKFSLTKNKNFLSYELSREKKDRLIVDDKP
jgi:hypothetical protein